MAICLASHRLSIGLFKPGFIKRCYEFICNICRESGYYSLEGGAKKIRTMIEGFDDISHGGLPVGRSTLVSGTSGTGKTLLAMQFLYHGLTYFDEPGVFVTF